MWAPHLGRWSWIIIWPLYALVFFHLLIRALTNTCCYFSICLSFFIDQAGITIVWTSQKIVRVHRDYTGCIEIIFLNVSQFLHLLNQHNNSVNLIERLWGCIEITQVKPLQQSLMHGQDTLCVSYYFYHWFI